jgi:hypothetical protein
MSNGTMMKQLNSSTLRPPELPKSLFAKEGFQGVADAERKKPVLPRAVTCPVIPAEAGIQS